MVKRTKKNCFVFVPGHSGGNVGFQSFIYECNGGLKEISNKYKWLKWIGVMTEWKGTEGT